MVKLKYMFMVRNCPKCGTQLKATDLFCPNCGNRITAGSDEYMDVLEDIIYVDGRLSRAKMIGVVLGFVVFVYYVIFLIPYSLRVGFLAYFPIIVACFIHILLVYCICRGGGYLIRRSSN